MIPIQDVSTKLLIRIIIEPKVEREKRVNIQSLVSNVKESNPIITMDKLKSFFLGIVRLLSSEALWSNKKTDVEPLLIKEEKFTEEDLNRDQQDAIDEFTRRVIKGDLDYIKPPHSYYGAGYEDKYWKEFRALMLTLLYSQLSNHSINAFQNKFTELTFHDDLPYLHHDPEYTIAYHRALKIVSKSDDFYSGGFKYFEFPAKRDGISKYSQLESFIRSTNCNHSESGFKYKHYTPMQLNKFDINSFPGPGFVIDGLHSKINKYLERELWHPKSYNDSPDLRVENTYRQYIVDGEEYLQDTTFSFFRGIQIVLNEKNMIVDKKPHALIVFNDHFHNDFLKIAYLLPVKAIKEFIQNPIAQLNEENILYPSEIEKRFKDVLIKLTGVEVVGGMNKGLPVGAKHYAPEVGNNGEIIPNFFNKDGIAEARDILEYERTYHEKETTGVSGHIHYTHMFGGYWFSIDPRNLLPLAKADKEIAHCALFGLSQLDLFYDGFRNFNLGFSYDESDGEWKFEPKQLLDQAVRWHNSEKIKLEEKPLLVPIPRLQYSQIDPNLFKLGILDTKSMELIKHGKKIQLPKDVSYKVSPEMLKLWASFVKNINDNHADLSFIQGKNIREIVSKFR